MYACNVAALQARGQEWMVMTVFLQVNENKQYS